ncbi:MAG: hypothetical protein NUW22_05370, partial [Acidobacteria bacterium]|nr:hypothetical protein [Acidobacteriota bacterium]
MRSLTIRIAGVAITLGAAGLIAQVPAQPEQDAYTRIELASPDTGSFRVIHEAAAVTAGATEHAFYPWPRTQGSGFRATDLMTGAALTVTADAGVRSVRMTLARPVPRDGQGRIRFQMDARNPGMYKRDGLIVTFTWPIPSPRGTVVLPAGYEVLSADIASQILSEPDGRIAVSYMHQIAGDATMTVTMRAGVPTGPAAAPTPLTNARSWEPASQRATERARLTERATQDRDIVYFLQQPGTSAFSLYHDYTESRPGTDKYLNVVRTGARVSNPSAYVLDTGEALRHETLKGAAVTAANLSVGEVTPETEVVVIHFPAVKQGQSLRLRISETYTTPESYRLDGPDLVFER